MERGITNYIFQLFAHAIIIVVNSNKDYTSCKVFVQILKDCLVYSQNEDK